MAVMQRELALPALRNRRQPRRWDRLGAVGTLALLGMAIWCTYTLVGLAASWISVKLDDVRYGYPRTFQADAYIGYQESSGLPTHFTVINAHRQVLIMIVPGTHPDHVTVIRGPYLFGPDQDFSPATLDVTDVNHDGYPDLVLHVAGQSLVYLNDPRHHTFLLPRAQNGGGR